jgi:hypothetical protein
MYQMTLTFTDAPAKLTRCTNFANDVWQQLARVEIGERLAWPSGAVHALRLGGLLAVVKTGIRRTELPDYTHIHSE